MLTKPAATPEDQQLLQTVEMFEVITQSQPQDIQSLEILKEAYVKLGRQREFIDTSKRIAQAYVDMGQLSSAILEYEGILQRYPDDPDVQAALAEIEGKAINVSASPPVFETDFLTKGDAPDGGATKPKSGNAVQYDDGRAIMHKIFVEGKELAQSDFDLTWSRPPLDESPVGVIEPFVQLLADRALVTLEKSLHLLASHSKLCYLPLEKYDFDIELARSVPRDICQRWCVLPVDRMSKAVLVATSNPFNKQAAMDLEAACKARLLWYLASPVELTKALKKVFR
jgi:tetratricopeptide (TPR) repeat protein